MISLTSKRSKMKTEFPEDGSSVSICWFRLWWRQSQFLLYFWGFKMSMSVRLSQWFQSFSLVSKGIPDQTTCVTKFVSPHLTLNNGVDRMAPLRKAIKSTFHEPRLSTLRWPEIKTSCCGKPDRPKSGQNRRTICLILTFLSTRQVILSAYKCRCKVKMKIQQSVLNWLFVWLGWLSQWF